MEIPENQFFYKNNRLQQLRGFCAAMQFGNLTRAAEQLGLSHTAISLQIKSLEDDLKIKLFERQGPKIRPTKDAAILYKIASQHVEGINNIYDEFITQRNDDLSDELNIAANNASLNYILPKLMVHYSTAAPNIYSRIHFAEQPDGLEKLKRGEIDVLLLPRREHMPVEPAYFTYTPLFYFTPVLLTLPSHPLAGKKKISVEQIAKYEFTLPAKGLHVIPNLHELFSRYEINKRLRVNFEGWEVTRKYIEAGLVISITADIVHEKENDMLVKTPLTHLFPVVDYGFVTRRDKHPDKKLRQLFETAKKHSKSLSSDILPR